MWSQPANLQLCLGKAPEPAAEGAGEHGEGEGGEGKFVLQGFTEPEDGTKQETDLEEVAPHLPREIKMAGGKSGPSVFQREAQLAAREADLARKEASLAKFERANELEEAGGGGGDEGDDAWKSHPGAHHFTSKGSKDSKGPKPKRWSKPEEKDPEEAGGRRKTSQSTR